MEEMTVDDTDLQEKAIATGVEALVAAGVSYGVLDVLRSQARTLISKYTLEPRSEAIEALEQASSFVTQEIGGHLANLPAYQDTVLKAARAIQGTVEALAPAAKHTEKIEKVREIGELARKAHEHGGRELDNATGGLFGKLMEKVGAPSRENMDALTDNGELGAEVVKGLHGKISGVDEATGIPSTLAETLDAPTRLEMDTYTQGLRAGMKKLENIENLDALPEVKTHLTTLYRKLDLLADQLGVAKIELASTGTSLTKKLDHARGLNGSSDSLIFHISNLPGELLYSRPELFVAAGATAALYMGIRKLTPEAKQRYAAAIGLLAAVAAGGYTGIDTYFKVEAAKSGLKSKIGSLQSLEDELTDLAKTARLTKDSVDAAILATYKAQGAVVKAGEDPTQIVEGRKLLLGGSRDLQTGLGRIKAKNAYLSEQVKGHQRNVEGVSSGQIAFGSGAATTVYVMAGVLLALGANKLASYWKE